MAHDRVSMPKTSPEAYKALTGVESYLGAEMFWDHVDTATYLEWFRDAGLLPQWHRFVPEGDGGHTLILARGLTT